MSKQVFRALLFACGALLAPGIHAGDAPPPIAAAELAAQLRTHEPVTVVDVRTPEEYAAGHVPGAINIPHDQIGDRVGELEAARDRPLVVYCRTGRRAGLAAEVLKSKGFGRILHLDGDMVGWQAQGLPVEPPPAPETPH